MADDGGHQLAMIEYPNLPRDYALDAVHRIYDEYYFRPKAVWRIVKKAMKDSNDRKRLYREAREFMSLRSKRAKVAKEIRAEVAVMKSKVKTETASVSGD